MKAGVCKRLAWLGNVPKKCRAMGLLTVLAHVLPGILSNLGRPKSQPALLSAKSQRVKNKVPVCLSFGGQQQVFLSSRV